MATLTFVYADSSMVLGPLSKVAEPHTYDVCSSHATRLTAPRGWDLVRLPIGPQVRTAQDDDLLALADAVRAVPPRMRAVEVSRRPLGSEKHPAGRARPKPALYVVE